MCAHELRHKSDSPLSLLQVCLILKMPLICMFIQCVISSESVRVLLLAVMQSEYVFTDLFVSMGVILCGGCYKCQL